VFVSYVNVLVVRWKGDEIVTFCASIGVLDSGVGGLTVVREMFRQIPQENVIYYGDTARCPYGQREPEEVRRFTFEIMDFLMEQGVKMIVIACNTATAIALNEARVRYSVPVVGVITPGSRAAISATANGRIGVIGTEVTIRSEAYVKEILRINPDLYVRGKACAEFVPIVEAGLSDDPSVYRIVDESVQDFRADEVDVLILGCTHYPLLQSMIARSLGPCVQLINSAEETARDVSAVLSERGLLNQNNSQANHRFCVSGHLERFEAVGREWLQRHITVECVKLD